VTQDFNEENHLLRADELAEFGEFILAHREDITRHWVGAVDRSDRIDSSEGLTYRQLLDHLPEICVELANVLKQTGAEALPEDADRPSIAHAHRRWQQGYRLDEVLREFCIIRRDFLGRWLAAFEEKRGPLNPHLRSRAKRLVHKFFDNIMIESAVQYVDEQRQEMKQTEVTLRQLSETAQAAEEAKTHFLDLLSHELRTPLTPALLEVSALQEDRSLSPEVGESLKTIRHNIEIEAALVDDLLDASRLAEGRLTLPVAPIDVHDCINEAAVSCGPDYSMKGIPLALRLDAPRSTIAGDAAHLRRAFSALLRNAANVSRPGSEVEVVSRNLADLDQLEISVRDSGVRADRETLQRIFNPFDEGRRSIFGLGGLGVGRYVGKAIIEAHGGTLTAAPAGPEGGAVFTVILPLRQP
jgi:signal transduction histidine kinase